MNGSRNAWVAVSTWDPSRIYDVLVLGGGNAALCAALSARPAGCSVLIVESSPAHFRGGNSRHTRNLRCMGARLGLSDQWAYNTIKAMGNFGEIYERNLGSQSPYKLDRGMNALWRDKGVFVPMLID